MLLLVLLVCWEVPLAKAQSISLPPNPGYATCHICGLGLVARKTDQLLRFPDQPVVSCTDLEFAGLDGYIEPSACAAMPGMVSLHCDCGVPEAPTAPPVRGQSSAPPSNNNLLVACATSLAAMVLMGAYL